jgi:hypothetical protein
MTLEKARTIAMHPDSSLSEVPPKKRMQRRPRSESRMVPTLDYGYPQDGHP